MVSHNLQQRGAAEAGGVNFAVEQRMGAAVMLLQEVRNWARGQNVVPSKDEENPRHRISPCMDVAGP